ncbi:ATP-dependent DNA helicase Q4 [Diachasma alloeum]|uniref:DNA 3'-5' helicase n=1 Tax=Diachasma alloeum TaxID=454923 RepID=A0A4E0S3T2_9HYME|nr:ATP-dependent DNA helicase Q4 [Diachasma alloeum]THK33065.1 DNA helicase RecQ4 [Diachasma alloeum]
MELLEHPSVKIKYQKCKLRVKRWESDFMEKYGRRPNKNDIKKADSRIKESYKMYWKLKTQALEETLLDITFTDEIQANVSANSLADSLNASLPLDSSLNLPLDTSVNSETPEASKDTFPETSLKNVENIDPEKTPTKSEKSPTKTDSSLNTSDSKKDNVNIDGAWGDHLNKGQETSKKSTKRLIGRSTSFQLSQKKFTSGTFSKRNPRKSLSMTKIKSKTDLNKSTSVSSSPNDEKPLETGQEPTSDGLFGENLKITQLETKVTAQPVNAVRKLMNGAPAVAERKLNPGWLERCAKDTGLEPLPPVNPQRLSGISDSGVESMDTSVFSPPESAPSISAENSAQISDDEEFVCNSDSEEENNRKRVRNWRKTLSDGSLPQFKRPCLALSPEMPVHTTVPTDVSSQRQETAISSKITETVSQNTKTTTIAGGKTIDDKLLHVNQINTKVSPKKSTESLESSSASAPPRKKITRKSKKIQSDDEEYEEEKPKTRKPRVSRKKPAVKKRKELKDVKPQRVSKRTTRARKKPESEDEEPDEECEDVEQTKSSPNIPIYGVEALEVVPRFAVPRDSNGDLISEFSQTIGKSLAPEKFTKKPKSLMTEKEKFEEKVASGKANENFVRINLKKKIFVRGKRSFNFSRYKKNQWKQKKKELASSEGALDLADLAEKNTCFKCGATGHMSRKCPAMKSDELLPLEETSEEISEFPTLEQVEKMANEEAIRAHATRINLLPKCPSMSSKNASINASGHSRPSEHSENSDEEFHFDEDDFEDIDEEKELAMVGHKIPEDLVAKLLPPVNGAIDPVYPSLSTGELQATPEEVFDTLKMFGHNNFRPGQEKAVMRILSGQSTLVTLSTGSGKSLCYQLPAYLYSKRSHCITLVISPLVSLMDDQVTGIPSFLSAAALHTGQTQAVREKIMQTVKDGNLDILLVSPEAVVAGEKSTGFGSLLRQLPPIAFACIDEAHCISQWSHNFRPSYLMICRVLLEKLGVKTILGLTATATRHNAESIVEHLRIHDGMDGVISDIPMPNNLILSVSKDEHRDQALISLLRSERFKECDSIIVYCTRREECLRIAGTLRISLQDTVDKDKPKPKVKVSQIAEAYHAGLAPSRRKVIQKAFMKGVTRIVVATVAFGMGINKPDIRSVIHYNMPKSFEGYVQEVGRAGRDNLPAHCHLFLSPTEDCDKWELRRHVYQDGVDRHTIRKLLQKIFVPCSCPQSKSRNRCPGHEVAIPINETVAALDISEETISTLLCYLELHPKKFITVLSSVYVTAKVSSYNGPKALKAAAQSSPPLAMAIALDAKRGISHENSSVIEFPVVDVAAAIGWDSGVVKSHLKNLEWTTVEGRSTRSVISVRYEKLGLRVRAPGDLDDAELDEALEALFERTQSQEKSSLHQLEIIYAALNGVSYNSIRECMELNDESLKKSESLKEIIREYFQSCSPLEIVEKSESKPIANESLIISDIRSLISNYKDNNFTGRAVARIFHGIPSPNYSALTWSRCRFWRAHMQTDFNAIVQIATREILASR